MISLKTFVLIFALIQILCLIASYVAWFVYGVNSVKFSSILLINSLILTGFVLGSNYTKKFLGDEQNFFAKVVTKSFKFALSGTLVVVALLIGWVSLFYIEGTGACEGIVPLSTSDDYIYSAIAHVIEQNKGKSQFIQYETVEEFLEKNPGCCTFLPDPYKETPKYEKDYVPKRRAVALHYLGKTTKEERFLSGRIYFNKCNHIVEYNSRVSQYQKHHKPR